MVVTGGRGGRREYAVYSILLGHRLPFATAAVLVKPVATAAFLLLPLAVVLFPDGRLASRRWWWVLGAVDRRFNRARYDADQTVTAFAGQLKDAVDLDSVRDDLAAIVQQTLEPTHLSVWISRQGPDVS